MNYHRQCVLSHKIGDGEEVKVAWIPEKFAVKGKYLELKEDDGWENGWQVMEVGVRQASEAVRERSLDYRNQRKASDV